MVKKVVLNVIVYLAFQPFGGFARGEYLTDYVSIFNQQAKPSNYDKGDNAASDYDKAIELFHEAGISIEKEDIRCWPNELKEQKQKEIEKWLQQNDSAIEHVLAGTQKPYYWKKMKSSNDSITGISTSNLGTKEDLMRLLCYRAKLKAVHGDIAGAVEDLAVVCKFGKHMTGPKTVVEQIVGVSFQRQAVETALMVLDRAEVKGEELEVFDSLLQICKADTNLDFMPLRLIAEESLQWAYISDGKSMAFSEKGFHNRRSRLNLHFHNLFYRNGIFLGGFRKGHEADMSYAIAEKSIMQGMDELEHICRLEAWQLHQLMNDDLNVLAITQRSHPFLNTIALVALNHEICAFERFKAYVEGLEATLGVLRFADEEGRLPEGLDELQHAGIMALLPMDPFSGDEIKYKKVGDSFTIYSYGLDFDDDAGKRWVANYLRPSDDGDLVMFPSPRKKPKVMNPLFDVRWPKTQ
ncbi:hypothetical protein STSP2_01380 [Anaerohalosphaera lusitana]|uniref:Uncharacterized protein n=1 Tax=Anaerohalosphaera lusitana TaxID=1936003 RepID=A0A1U9NKG6_9BACT|nr:hypothetical protein [Anaerohalosphaera lusitana]AQT68224.1 hypothetical protein STSP2_01380 [Anaerohalosphaera lusitana]